MGQLSTYQDSPQRFGVLIATRNRPTNLEALLNSLIKSTTKFKQIVVVSSGVPIEETLIPFVKVLPISHAHLEEKGQIRQKMHGVKMLQSNLDWVVFLDDDVLLERNAITNVIRTLEKQQDKSSIIGIGLSDKDFKPSRQSILKKIFSLVFLTNTDRRGAVLRNGQNNDYMGSGTALRTSWLNGAAIWRRQAAETYGIPFLNAKYSICEDLIFSYPFSKHGVLLFDPSSCFSFQQNQDIVQSTKEGFQALTYWRLYFVLTNRELSKSLFLWSQIGRTINYIYTKNGNSDGVIQRVFYGFKILFDVVSLIINKVPPVEILELRQSDN